MDKLPPFSMDGRWIRSLRDVKNEVDINKPYAFLSEKEHTLAGKIDDVITIFLTNRECPFTCLMCDLWKNTTDFRIPAGAIPSQIHWALDQLPQTKHIKLYNSGNFFDARAIPEEDHRNIASLLHDFDTVIVESHPKLINKKTLRFRDMLQSSLHVAIGLETAHPKVLSLLNKQMKLEDFKRSVRFLCRNEIHARAFILLRPPFLEEDEGIEWAKRSIEFAFECGVECCVIIPTRSGNGATDWLRDKGYFSPPDISSLEAVLDYGIRLKAGRVFADLWDIELFSSCDDCLPERKKRLEECNLKQQILPPVLCRCNQ
jgi:radical SAM enzyme (TIGR01210 family)